MRKVEQRLWDRFRSNLGEKMLLNRIENAIGAGDPDVEALCNGVFSKIELKARETPPMRAETPLLGRDGLNPQQRNFLRRWTQYGGRGFILIGIGRGSTVRQFLLHGQLCDRVNEMTLVEIEGHAIARSWAEIGRRLGVQEKS